MKLKIFLSFLSVAILAGLLSHSQRQEASHRVSGFVDADEIRVGSRVGGRLAEVFVQEGQSVAVGQILIRLEPFALLERMKSGALHFWYLPPLSFASPTYVFSFDKTLGTSVFEVANVEECLELLFFA